jgi:uncharacterized OB-fold protein
MLKAQSYPAIGFECPRCGHYQYADGPDRHECESCGRKVDVSRPVYPEVERLMRKISHGCTDALCPDCDR